MKTIDPLGTNNSHSLVWIKLYLLGKAQASTKRYEQQLENVQLAAGPKKV